ncbi:psbP-like protein 1, chloroplastic [Dioscorea cayenensis subsp. rotundata]|uniref:PsbP-like protein 1, chloroplastic n=1 Tax=Dioscorea cayennensis subsp. rotundata TaxID=55577 RepID=A0AB40BNX5_DIOCR|nr:psbP-like protein 1, chloroplastic [Dioscorea cayenensis subsp. rotundata]
MEKIIQVILFDSSDFTEFGDDKQVLALASSDSAPVFTTTKVVVQGQGKVFKDVIEPLERVNANTVATTREILETLDHHKRRFYTLTTVVNERRWEKMKDKLHTDIDSFKTFVV